jgi:hypothetical protein
LNRDTLHCCRERLHLAFRKGDTASYEEEDTCHASYEEEDTCHMRRIHLAFRKGDTASVLLCALEGAGVHVSVHAGVRAEGIEVILVARQ